VGGARSVSVSVRDRGSRPFPPARPLRASVIPSIPSLSSFLPRFRGPRLTIDGLDHHMPRRSRADSTSTSANESGLGSSMHDRFFLGGAMGAAPLLGFDDARVGGQVGQRDQVRVA
jgi:hypothetical protein